MINDCKVIELPKIGDNMGNLTVIESEHIPFPIARIYYLYGIPCDVTRGNHAHKKLQQLIIAISGSFELIADDGYQQKTIHLNNPAQGFYICPMVWRSILNFSSDAVCMVLASTRYDEGDYYRDYHEFLRAVR